MTKTLTTPQLQLIPPRLQTKSSSSTTVTGNRYDIVLACQPDAGDHYYLYDGIVELVEEKENLRIYSPHDDIKRGKATEEAVSFTVTEAIPRTKGVLVHLTTVTLDIQKMFDATYHNNRPFILFYADETEPFNEANAKNIRAHHCFRGECTYYNEEHAINQLEELISDLLRAN